MNILCLDQFGELGGAQRCLLDLLPAFASRGWNVSVASPPGPLLDRAASFASIDSIRSGPYSSGSKTLSDTLRFAAEAPRLARHLRQLIHRQDSDLVYVNGPRLLPAVALAARRNRRVLFHSHSLLSGTPLRVVGAALRLTRAAIVASSRFVAAPLRAYSGFRSERVIYNGVSPKTNVCHRPAPGEFRIGVIGRVAPEKGQADFLRAARLLHASSPHCRFLICGAPLFSDPAAIAYSDTLVGLAAGLPVEFVGWTDDVDAVLSRLDLLVVPSTTVDATPRVILEAFAAGVPVAAFASGGIPELIAHNRTGLLAGERTPSSLAVTVLDAMSSPGNLSSIAARARTQAATEFSLERYRARMVDAVEAAMAR